MVSDPIPLKDLSLEEVSMLLRNCGYSSNLVDPFYSHGVHGRVLDVVDSVEELTEIDQSIKKFIARGFFNKHLVEWKKNGVPKTKLEAVEEYIKVPT